MSRHLSITCSQWSSDKKICKMHYFDWRYYRETFLILYLNFGKYFLLINYQIWSNQRSNRQSRNIRRSQSLNAGKVLSTIQSLSRQYRVKALHLHIDNCWAFINLQDSSRFNVWKEGKRAGDDFVVLVTPDTVESFKTTLDVSVYSMNKTKSQHNVRLN